jgi:hypothetical protein
MNEKPFTSIFSRVRDQYSAAVRWTYLAVILLLLIHLLTVGPFIELSREKSKTEPEINRLKEVKSKIEGIGFEDVNDIISEPLTTFVKDLRFDFKCLDFTVQDLRLPDKIKSMIPQDLSEIYESILLTSEKLGEVKLKYNIRETESELPEAAENQLREMLNSNKFRESVKSAQKKDHNFSVQRNTETFFEEKQPFKITDSNLLVLEKIKLSKNRAELLEALKPYVEEKIIKPGYNELNDYWENNILPDIHIQFKKLTKDVNDLKSDFPEGNKEWDKLAEAFEDTNSAASKLKFKQPTEPPFWWSSVKGKERERRELEGEVTSQWKDPAVLNPLREQVTQLFTEEKKLGEKIDKDMKKLKDQFDEQQKKLGSIAKPLQFLAFDLESVMVIFPLLLGLILASATAWTTLRLRELGWTIHLMIKEGADQLLWDWYCAQVFLLLPKSSNNMTKQHNSSLIRKSLCLCAMSWIWIGITAWRMYGISEISLVRLVVVTCIGATVTALAQVHHYVVINSTLSLKGEQAASVATSSQE